MYILAKREVGSRSCVIILFFIVTLLLVACQKNEQTSPSPSIKDGVDIEKDANENRDFAIAPIDVEVGSFHSIGGWLNDETIYYITDSSTGSNVYTHHLNSGDKKLLFESNSPIVSTLVSPSREYLLIHSAPSSNEASLTIINKDGEKIMEEILPSSELNIQWNPYDEAFILITAFTEDWDFTVWNLNLDNNTLSKVALPQPFAYWTERQKLLYLNWDLDSPSLHADLVAYDLQTGESNELLSDVLQISTYRDLIVVVKVDELDEKKSEYLFLTNEFNGDFSFSAPHLSSYSEWVVPFSDYNQKTDSFLTYQPLYSVEADVYNEGFQLVSYHLDTGEKEIMMEDMENTPIACSPNGSMCLTGFYYEKLIDLENKKIHSLVESER
ncbi:hypothetical protein PZE06_20620 [Robertmurraya sp. DFI.2.37]|uniref:YqgU-like beta propeller domain-containing protein n=1 Tax=Robertmurraya sp. DFI.2.37 TaxID=3031819 RepID=UPI001243B1C6|nr:hypothetical protein [Robertmurraya sp. DFI.2.37]MDF1510541.1 hypothetical protein [Robertmurraya sp. DFI.2.37]